MAEAVVAAVTAAGVEAATAVVIGEAISWTSVALAAGRAFAISALASVLRGDGPAQSVASAQARKQSLRSSVAPRKIVYGTARISGTLSYAGSSGADNGTLWLSVPFHHGEFDGIEETYLNDKLIDDAQFSGVASQTVYYGTTTQTADADLIANTPDWSVAHRMRGIGYGVLKETWNATAYPYGIPNPSWVIRGRKLYDPRDGSTAWSNNWALAVLDWLIGTTPTEAGTRPIGIGAGLDEIDTDSFIAAANIADEAVPLAAGGTQARYTCDGVISLDESPTTVMERLLTAGAGTLVYSGGKYRLYAGVARPVTAPTLTAGMLRDALRYRPRESRGKVFNVLRGTYVDPDAYYEAREFPPQVDAAAIATDGERVEQTIELPFTADGIRAQRIARQLLARQRAASASIALPFNWSALGVAVHDTKTLEIDLLGLTDAQKWVVADWQIAGDGGIDITLQGESDAAYDWSTDDEQTVEPALKPTLVDGSIAAIAGLTVDSASSITSAGDYAGALYANWDNATSAFVGSYDVEALDHGTGAVVWSGRATQSAQLIPGLSIGTAYDVRVRARHVNGGIGAWSTETSITPSGDTVAPGQCTSITATPGTGVITIEWINPIDADYRKTRLYWHSSNDYASATLLDTRYGLPGALGGLNDSVAGGTTRYYWPIAVDASGNPSTAPAAVSATAL